MGDTLSENIRADVERLCRPGDRDLGTQRNRDATDYVSKRLRDCGLEVTEIEFDVPEWRFGSAIVSGDGLRLEVHPGPFSTSVTGEGPLVIVRSADELRGLAEPGAVLLLAGDIASTQFTPRGYPFYSNDAHAAILGALEDARPLAIVAATDKSDMTGAMSPFPLIEEVGFAVPTAYMSLEQGMRLAEKAGELVSVTIESEVIPSSGAQVIGSRRGSQSGRIVVSAHIDSKPETPGAIDNAAGVAVMLAVADLLRDSRLDATVDFVPFNGEDHVLAPGELAWLDANADLSDVLLAVNIDAPGLPGDPSAFSLYGVDEPTRVLAAELASDTASMQEGPQWPASDHMIFAMRGIPALAVTSTDFATASRGYSHTPDDVPEILDYDLLAGTARFIAALVRGLRT